MVVLAISAGSTGNWLYALIKSNFEKIDLSRIMAGMSWICEIGYLSGLVIVLSAR